MDTAPLHIVQVIDALGPGGAERLLCAYAPRLAGQGHRVSVVVLSDRGGNPMRAMLETASISVTVAKIDKIRRAGQFAAALRHIAGLRPDVVHSHLHLANLVGAVGKKWRRSPLVSTLHTLDSPSGLSREGLRVTLSNRAIAAVADRVICLSPAAAALARRHGFAGARMEILPNGIELERFGAAPAETRTQVRRSLQIAETAPLLICVAVLRRAKGIDRLVAAMSEVRRHLPAAELLIVGDGEEREALEAQVAGAGLGGALRLLGARTDVPELMAAADVFVLPTLVDTQPTVIMEAMASRLPVIASDTGGVPDMITHGADGLLTAPGDVEALAACIVRLLSEPELARAIAGAGRRRAEAEFSIDIQCQKLAAIYRAVIAEQR